MKILLLDIETAPNLTYIWGLHQELHTMDMFEKNWYILCWAAKWLGEKEIYSSALTDFKGYQQNPEDDKNVLLKLVKLLDEADIVIAHNGIEFDRRKINARLIMNGIQPPAPYRMIDTLKVCRSEFAFTSNKLADLAKFLQVGSKINTGGFELWRRCLNGDKKAWVKMVKYCKGDITLLERVYLKLRPYMPHHPNVNIYTEGSKPACPKCNSTDVHYRGYSCTNLSRFKRFQCNDCGGWGRERLNIIEKEIRVGLTVNA